MKILFFVFSALVLMTLPVDAQTTVKNPSKVTFVCPDHALDDQHELDIIRKSDNVVIQTILLGDPPADSSGLVTANINVQPVTFGVYVSAVRAVAGLVKSDSSAVSNTWERAPGQPSKLAAQ